MPAADSMSNDAVIPNHILVMKVGLHLGEPWAAILERKQAE
jgi:hypothetical protein